MKNAITILIALSVIFGLTITTFAHQPPGKVSLARKRQHNQGRRIAQGVRSGELTRGEVKSISHQQRDVNQEIRSAKSDGTVTRAERREIRQEQNQASRQIFRKKHNRRDRN